MYKVSELYREMCKDCEIPVKDAIFYNLTIKDLQEIAEMNERLKNYDWQTDC